MIAKDMKIREMITMMADTPVEEIARFFNEDRIGGLSVLSNKIR